uniref:Leucine-rich repeat domain-containing protein n=1 Tax=Panagrolaimus superbus TaxID=310955 RepID=A0A914ZI42_9BILA
MSIILKIQKISDHALNDKRISIIKDFTKTKEIKLFRSKLPKINPKWFNATNLDTLDLSRVYPFDFDEAGQWKIFADGIKNCQKLKSLTFHDCGIEEIPDSVFGALPESLITLSLGDNNIKRISPKISRLKNLYALNVSYNPELSDEGFPWKFLPETLHMLDLSKTDLKQIPSDVERLKELERLIIGKSVAYIKWKCLPQSLDELTVDGDGKLNILRSMQRFYLFRVLGLRNAGLKRANH